MRLTLVSIGTRGDTQPIIALGKALKAAGYEVTLVVGSNFAEWVERHGLNVAPISIDMQAVMNTPDGLKWMEGGNDNRQFRHMIRLMNEFGPPMAVETWEKIQDSDAILASFTTESFADSAAEKLGIPFIRLPLQPLEPSRNGMSSLVVPFRHRNLAINKALGTFVYWLLQRQVFSKMVNSLRTGHLGLPALSARQIAHRLRHAPAVCGFSEHVVPRAPDWLPNIHISGYWFLDEQADWQPPAGLEAFLNAGSAPVYFGFGSMSSTESEKTTHIIIEAAQRAGVRALIQSGWAGLGTEHLPENVCLLGNAPHDYLFPKMRAVVHHGGAGTTSAGLRAGKPAVIVPHINEQAYWGDVISAIGVGRNAGYRSQLTVDKLTEALKHTLQPHVERRAGQLGEKIRAENGTAEAVRWIQHYLENRD